MRPPTSEATSISFSSTVPLPRMSPFDREHPATAASATSVKASATRIVVMSPWIASNVAIGATISAAHENAICRPEPRPTGGVGKAGE